LRSGDVCSQLRNHSIAPLGGLDFAADGLPRLPVKINQSGVYGLQGPLAGRSYQADDLSEGFFILSHQLELRRVRIIWFHAAFQS
jgi:hypothetical protein